VIRMVLALSFICTHRFTLLITQIGSPEPTASTRSCLDACGHVGSLLSDVK